MMLSKGWRWFFWAGILLLLGGLAALRMDQGELLSTNVLQLLPDYQATNLEDKANQQNRQMFDRQLLILLEGKDRHDLRQLAQDMRALMLAAGLEETADDKSMQAALKVYAKHRYALLDEADIERLQAGGASRFATDVAASMNQVGALADDPGGYFRQMLAHFPRPYKAFTADAGMLMAEQDGHTQYLLRLLLPATAFSEHGMQVAADALQDAHALVEQQCSDCRMRVSGAVLFSQAASAQAKFETTWLTLISTVFIMLLIAYVFHSLAPHLLGFLQLFSSIFAAVAGVVIVFGHINILTLVFGTTLLGIVIDYAFLYFCSYWFGRGSSRDVLANIGGGMGMGLVTGVVAFFFMLLTGFPALEQIAVFSIAGLVEACLVVVLIFPLVLRHDVVRSTRRFTRWPQAFVKRVRHASWQRHAVPLILLVLVAPGWWMLELHDDVRDLSHFPNDLLVNEARMQQELGSIPMQGFYLLQGSHFDALLRQEKQLSDELASTWPDASIFSLSRFLPTEAQQQQSLAVWKDLFADTQDLAKAFAHTGLPPQLADYFRQAWLKHDLTSLTYPELEQALPEVRRLLVKDGKHYGLLVTALAPEAMSADSLKAIAHKYPHAEYVEPLAAINSTFTHIRMRAIWLVLASYILIAVLLCWRYAWREALRMLYPTLLTLGMTLGIMGLLGYTINVFVVVALILILGLGRDYTLFLREMDARQVAPTLAVTLSAMTTLGSFGLLTFSQIPVLHTFGIATLIGILTSFLTAPLALPAGRIEEEPQ